MENKYFRKMANKFEWTEEYSVQNAMIDEQHKTFFAMANEIFSLAESGDSNKEAILEQVTKLGNYAFFHLGTEEELFNKYGYNGAEHIAVHNIFRERVKELINSVRNNNEDSAKQAKEMADFSGSWLLNHIMTMDKQYAPFFADK